ncbi:MAG: small subunit ribosomal protein S3 [Candidatus Saganbacteria bacterium]|uniref:Small ribosomal subunit protein uS3 n=1 Tax=Candidatus Saganbacteria bacterium TaxID=2575572 RepID=A0A833NX30_UNCSA|nr:MAG: small subunit ribosomal protein S3 [Candidatus Saganbacteria bacterium]
MGQKAHPKGLRLGITEDWDAVWYADKKEYSEFLLEDTKLRKYLKENLYKAGISRILIYRRANQVEVELFTAKPGLIIGRGGKDINAIRDDLIKKLGKPIQLNIHEEKNPEASAQLLAESIAAQLEKRISFKRAMKQIVSRALKAHAKGIKIQVGGRLGGSEIARSETYRVGRVPLHTLRAKIDYGFTEANTIYGKIGVKVWVYKGDMVLDREKTEPKPISQSVIEGGASLGITAD